MSQSGFIAALLLAAFVLFLAANGRLKTYLSVVWGDTKAPLPKAGGSSGGGLLDSASDLVKSAAPTILGLPIPGLP